MTHCEIYSLDVKRCTSRREQREEIRKKCKNELTSGQKQGNKEKHYGKRYETQVTKTQKKFFHLGREIGTTEKKNIVDKLKDQSKIHE